MKTIKLTAPEPPKTVPTIVRPDWSSAQGDKYSVPKDIMEGGDLKTNDWGGPVKPDMLRDELPVDDHSGLRKDTPINASEKIGYQGEGD